ncbi:MAG: hypothetical protein ABEN55_19285 [Bradymonadaceae bacterium]
MGRTFEGTCRICGESWTGQGITSHIKRCVSDHANLGAVHHGLLVGMRADGPAGRYWAYVLVRPEASLATLDAALRELWFADDGAPSVFDIEGTRYVSSIGETEVSTESEESGEAEAPEKSDKAEESEASEEADESDEMPAIEPMSVDVGATIRPRMDFRYLYDPQDPTEVELTVYDPYPVPDSLLDAESEAEVVVAARNDLEGVSCSSCENDPSYVCLACAGTDEPEIGPFVCEACRDKHAEHEGELIELVNTPHK